MVTIMVNAEKYKSYWFYVPIVLALAAGYIMGGVLTFGVYFLNFFPELTNQTARLILTLFGMGMLGSTMYCIRFWAQDIDESIQKPELLPNLFDAFAYLATIIGGGITGVLLYLIVRTGTQLALVANDLKDLRIESALIIAFCGGLFHFQVEEVLKKSVRHLLEEKREGGKGSSI